MKIYHLAVLGQSVKWVGRAEFLPEPLGSFRRTHLLADVEGVGLPASLAGGPLVLPSPLRGLCHMSSFLL